MKRVKTKIKSGNTADVQATKEARIALRERLEKVRQKLPKGKPDLDEYASRAGDRSEDQLIKVITDQIVRSKKWSLRIFVSLAEYDTINLLHSSGKLEILCKEAILADTEEQIRRKGQPLSRILKPLRPEDLTSVHFDMVSWPLYVREQKELVMRLFIYMDGPVPFRAKPAKTQYHSSLEAAQATQKQWRIEDPHYVVVIEKASLNKKQQKRYVVKCWHPFEFLEAELPWVDPAEIIYEWIDIFHQQETTLLEQETRRWKQGETTAIKAGRRHAVIIKAYNSMGREHADGQKTWFVEEILHPALRKKGRGYGLTTIKTITSDLPWPPQL